jgi:hypothetical protein
MVVELCRMGIESCGGTVDWRPACFVHIKYSVVTCAKVLLARACATADGCCCCSGW